MENRTVSVIVQKFLSAVSDILRDHQARSVLKDPITILPFWASDTSVWPTRNSKDLSAAPTCKEITRDTPIQRSNPQKQQQDPRHRQTCRHPHTGPAGPSQSPQTEVVVVANLLAPWPPRPRLLSQDGFGHVQPNLESLGSRPLGSGGSGTGGSWWQQAAAGQQQL